ncbi:MAG TPA: hypothetical protein VHW66_19840 [Stellaceae bacterium]|nr:hypothetical protein [Stellaceae bacterium]
MRRILSLLALLLVAACEGSGPAPLPVEQVTASFPPHGIADVIVIDAADALPLRAATLIAPDGSTIPADGVEVNARPGSATGLSASADPTRGGLVQLNPPGPVAIPAIHSEGRLLITISRASISLPDMVAYRRDWQRCRIRLDFGTAPGAVKTLELAAPEPPGPAAG